MTVKKLIPIVLLSLSLMLVAATTVPMATILNFIEVERDEVGGVDGLEGVWSVAVSADNRSVYATGAEDDGLAVFDRDGLTGELSFVEAHFDGVDGVEGLLTPRSVAVSPDNKHVYVTGSQTAAGGNTVAVFERETGTGVLGSLTFVAVYRDGEDGVDGLARAWSVVVSPDNKNVYVTGNDDDALAVFSRDPVSGTLKFLEVHKDGVAGVDGLKGAYAVTVSPDNKHVYVTSDPAGVQDDAVTVFARETISGTLTYIDSIVNVVGDEVGLAGPASVAVSPDGRHVYVAADIDDAVTVFSRQPISGTLSFVQTIDESDLGLETLDGAHSVVVSPDNKGVFVVTRGADTLLVFGRNPFTGHLNFLELHRDDVSGVDGLSEGRTVAVSPGSENVYVAAYKDSALSVFGFEGELPDTHLVFLPFIVLESNLEGLDRK
jgi:DNA-binding beta-propeller fold protein YncE